MLVLQDVRRRFFSGIKKTISAIQEGILLNLTEPPIRIGNIFYNDNEKTTYITLQLSGKNNYPILTASKIIADVKLTEMLLEDDKKYIRMMAKRDKCGITHKLLNQSYDSDSEIKCTEFSILHLDCEKIKVKKITLNALIHDMCNMQFDHDDLLIIRKAIEDHKDRHRSG